jgi:hypothetical protein
MGRLNAPESPTRRDDAPERFEVDVLVVGAGHAGMQAAHAAEAEGARVAVVERCSPATATLLQPAQAPQTPKLSWLHGHSALELLLDAGGAVWGAAGVRHLPGDAFGPGGERPWQARAGAVVIATGDGLLMAAEAGAALAGMDRGGGLQLRHASGASTVAGLYAAGRAAWHDDNPALPPQTRAHALLTGQWAGAAAAGDSLRRSPAPDAGTLRPAGRVGLRGPGTRPIDPQASCAALDAVLCNLSLAAVGDPTAALVRLDALWQFMRSAAPAPRGAQRVTREAAQRLAVARWRLHSQLAREADDAASAAIVTGGLDMVWARSVGPRRALDDGGHAAPHHPLRPALTTRLVAFAR